jgi:hypothetical protein
MQDGVGRLREVVGMIDDETGRGGFLQRLRMLLLQKVLVFSAYARYLLSFYLHAESSPFILYLRLLRLHWRMATPRSCWDHVLLG